MKYLLPLIALVALVLLMAGGEKRRQTGQTLLLTFAGIVVLIGVFFLILSWVL